MLEINIDPQITTIGPLALRWDFCAALLAGIIAFGYFAFRSKSSGLPRKHILWLCLLFLFSGLLCSWLLAITETFLYYNSTEQLFSFKLRGYGLFMGLITAAWIYTSRNKVSLQTFFDMGLPAVILFMAFYRIGCVTVGCCYGLPTDVPWSVIYSNFASQAPLNIPIHPTQFYHLIWNVIVFTMALLLQPKIKTAGVLTQIVLIVYFSGDFVIRLFRGDEPHFAGISLSQMIALVLVLRALSTLILKRENGVTEKLLTSKGVADIV